MQRKPLMKLRKRLFELDPDKAWMDAPEDVPEVWGLLIETGYPQGAVCLVALANGSASLYFENGGGVIGCGQHTGVRAAAAALLITAEELATTWPAPRDHRLPSRGRTRFFALTRSGVRHHEGDEETLAEGDGPLSSLFHAGQAVLTQIRLLTPVDD